MKAKLSACLIFLAVAATISATTARERRPREPYVGAWSNGRGETLVIKSNKVRFANDNALSYHDITRVTNEKEFQLEVTSDGKLNYLTRFLQISLSDTSDEMKVTLYNSRKDMESGQNSQGEATWYRDR